MVLHQPRRQTDSQSLHLASDFCATASPSTGGGVMTQNLGFLMIPGVCSFTHPFRPSVVHVCLCLSVIGPVPAPLTLLASTFSDDRRPCICWVASLCLEPAYTPDRCQMVAEARAPFGPLRCPASAECEDPFTPWHKTWRIPTATRTVRRQRRLASNMAQRQRRTPASGQKKVFEGRAWCGWRWTSGTLRDR